MADRSSGEGRGHAREHPHGHSVYEAREFLDAPAGERIPAQEIALGRRFANIRTIGSIVFALVLLFLLLRYVLNVDFGRTLGLILGADPVLLLGALVVYYATFPLRGLRWHFVLGRSGTAVPLPRATEILFLSWFVNCVVPAKLGDLYRAYLLRENYGASVSRTVGTIFIERIADIVVIFGLGVAAGYWSFRGRSSPELDAIFVVGFLFAAVLVIIVLGLRMFGPAVGRVLPARVGDLFDRFREGSVSALDGRSLLTVLFLTGLIWAGESLRLFLVVRALDLPGVTLGISASIFVALVASLLTAIPLTPAGVGFVEAGIVGALAIYGVAADPGGVAVALTDRAISVLSVIALGGALYAFSGMVRRAHGMPPVRRAAPPGG